MTDIQNIDGHIADCEKDSIDIFRFSINQLADFFGENFILDG
jgi:hypothetical protein